MSIDQRNWTGVRTKCTSLDYEQRDKKIVWHYCTFFFATPLPILAQKFGLAYMYYSSLSTIIHANAFQVLINPWNKIGHKLLNRKGRIKSSVIILPFFIYDSYFGLMTSHPIPTIITFATSGQVQKHSLGETLAILLMDILARGCSSPFLWL